MLKFRLTVILVLVIVALGSVGCASRFILEDKNETPSPVSESTPEAAVDDFTDRLKGVQTGGFDFVFVFRRKDGDILDSEDRRFLRENSPADTNQWVVTSDKKAAIAGSNYRFLPENLTALRKRFAVEDFSSVVEAPIPAPANSSPKVKKP